MTTSKFRLKSYFLTLGVILTVIGLETLGNSALGKTQQELEQEVKELSQRLERLENTPESTSEKNHQGLQPIETYWKDGVHFSYKRNGMDIQVGGRIHLDWLFWQGDTAFRNAYGEFDRNFSGPHLQDGVEFRRARIFIKGILYDHIAFKAEYDFAGGDADFDDVYIGLTKIPLVGTILIGHQQEPFTLNELTSNNYITFIERGLATIFYPGRNVGITVRNHIAHRLTYVLGVFRETDSFGSGLGENSYHLSMRVTGLPVYADDGKILVHVGAAYSFRNPAMDSYRIRQRPEAHLASIVLDTRDPVTGTDIQTDQVQLFGAEAAFVFGPFHAQAEYAAARIDVLPLQFFPPLSPFPWSGGNDALFQGWYVQMGYFLTGEHRPYKTSDGVFSRVEPNRVFMDGEGGWGAWEIAWRFSHLDLQDGFFNPGLGAGIGPIGNNVSSFGEINDYTWGLNWYLNPNTRVMFNYTFADPEPNGAAHLFNTRFQIDF